MVLWCDGLPASNIVLTVSVTFMTSNVHRVCKVMERLTFNIALGLMAKTVLE